MVNGSVVGLDGVGAQAAATTNSPKKRGRSSKDGMSASKKNSKLGEGHGEIDVQDGTKKANVDTDDKDAYRHKLRMRFLRGMNSGFELAG